MSMNGTIRRKAISAAKQGDWEAAADFNLQILEQNSDETSALNRLGIAYVQLNKPGKAKKAFSQVLELDKTNIIAKKHLSKIANKQLVAAPAFTRQHFIEEPGRTKIVELRRLANKQILEKLRIGTPCELKLKSRYISVEAEGSYVGALPEDISFRLGKLIKTGNTYDCFVRSCNGKILSVYIKEASRSPKNSNIMSFPGNKAAMNHLSDIDESYLLKEDIPIDILETDSDVEKSLDDVDATDLDE